MDQEVPRLTVADAGGGSEDRFVGIRVVMVVGVVPAPLDAELRVPEVRVGRVYVYALFLERMLPQRLAVGAQQHPRGVVAEPDAAAVGLGGTARTPR